MDAEGGKLPYRVGSQRADEQLGSCWLMAGGSDLLTSHTCPRPMMLFGSECGLRDSFRCSSWMKNSMHFYHQRFLCGGS